MNISPLQEMQSMKIDATNSLSEGIGFQQIGIVNNENSSANFSHMLSDALNSVNSLQKAATDSATRFDQGDRSLTLADVMIARNKSSVALDATIQVRNKMVEAYKEITNMPV